MSSFLREARFFSWRTPSRSGSRQTSDALHAADVTDGILVDSATVGLELSSPADWPSALGRQ